MAQALRRIGAAALALATFAPLPAGAADDRKPPYWVSLSAGAARMRTGPGQQYPATWLYKRAGLPMRVIATYPSWRKVRDPDGTEGWMLVRLLSSTRTAVVSGGTRELRAAPEANAAVRWRAQNGVVGKISRCSGGWCEFNAAGHKGYVETGALWGVDQGEIVD